jgi:hypothetical protein
LIHCSIRPICVDESLVPALRGGIEDVGVGLMDGDDEQGLLQVARNDGRTEVASGQTCPGANP